MNDPCHVRIRKASEHHLEDEHPPKSSTRIRAGSPAASPHGDPTPSMTQDPVREPAVQLVEVSPGLYDLIVTCRCGERHVVRVESLQKT